MILNRLVSVLVLATFSFFAKAQQVHFVYLQTENGQPFYVKLDNKVTSSSPAGYLILPKMSEGDYTISVGFPKKEFPEESFKVSLDKENKGFLLKNFGEKGWGLFNLQSFALVMGENANAPSSVKTLEDDPFSRMLASVVKDSSLLEKQQPSVINSVPDSPSVKPADTVTENNTAQIKVPDTTEAVKENALNARDTLVVMRDTTQVVVETPQPVISSGIVRTLQKKEKDGVEMVYVDKSDAYSDTIRIFMPVDTTSIQKPLTTGYITKSDSATQSHTTDTATGAIRDSIEKNNDAIAITPVELKKESDSIPVRDNSPGSANDSASEQSGPPATLDITGEEIKKQATPATEMPKVVNSSSTNSDCREFATNEDFLKLRNKIAAENNKDDMVKVSKKYFKLQCYSTEQIKNLSLLFLTDEGRFQFFESAYAFTSDSSQYHTLQSQLKDPFYVNKFRAMIHK
ncbi:MAG: DUF4476 domain-containing protein [Ginsengibacter sp.]